MTITRREWVALVLIFIFGMLGAWLYESGNDWLANFCVIPPSVYYVVASRAFVFRGAATS